MKITIIILAISLYVAFGEISFQWSKGYLIKKDWKKAHITFLIAWPIAWIIGLITWILGITLEKAIKDTEDMLK